MVEPIDEKKLLFKAVLVNFNHSAQHWTGIGLRSYAHRTPYLA